MDDQKRKKKALKLKNDLWACVVLSPTPGGARWNRGKHGPDLNLVDISSLWLRFMSIYEETSIKLASVSFVGLELEEPHCVFVIYDTRYADEINVLAEKIRDKFAIEVEVHLIKGGHSEKNQAA